ncbi:MAG: hypothetical protein QRY72_03490 [Candidatus Rhabdochlamydia sp.]
MIKLTLLLILLLLSSCASKNFSSLETLSSIQLLDRNGFSETISVKDRLCRYENSDFHQPQPYQKVTRMYGKASQGATESKITTYHSNGLLWQYLEIKNGRANGTYQEWHPNGQLNIEATVIEGIGDVSKLSQMSWIFDGESKVFDANGHLMASILYQQGKLEGVSTYYFPSSHIQSQIPYHQHEMHGVANFYDDRGALLETTCYEQGLKCGCSSLYDPLGNLESQEYYDRGKLLKGSYFSSQGSLLSQIEQGKGVQSRFKEGKLVSEIEYDQGEVDGVTKEFDLDQRVYHLYTVKNGIKEGKEWFYYPSLHPKLMMTWRQNRLCGSVHTWYDNGKIESQREFRNHQKQGSSFAWFKEGSLMLMEEYDQDLLVTGSYYCPWLKDPVSTVEKGSGIVTLFDADGYMTHQIPYEKGVPQGTE